MNIQTITIYTILVLVILSIVIFFLLHPVKLELSKDKKYINLYILFWDTNKGTYNIFTIYKRYAISKNKVILNHQFSKK